MPPVVTFFLDPQVLKEGGTFEAPRSGDAGFDIRAAENVTIAAGEQMLLATGLRVAIPAGWVGIIKDRSSMATRRIYTHAGVIDSGYRGEVRVLVSNQGREPFEIQSGAKIAQMVVVPHLGEAVQVDMIEKLGHTERGPGGFGSTGR